jgi:hypothetical protein
MNYRLVLLFLIFLMTFTPAVAGIQAIWAVGDGERIERFDRNNPLKNSNSVWDGEKVTLFGARNEIIAFQLIVESDLAGIGALTASLPVLTHRDWNSRVVYRPPELDPSQYVDRPIQLFSVNYVYVANPTKAS